MLSFPFFVTLFDCLLRHTVFGHSMDGNGNALPIEFPEKLTLPKGQETDIQFVYTNRRNGSNRLEFSLEYDPTILSLDPSSNIVLLDGQAGSVRVRGLALCSRTFIDLANCTFWPNGGTQQTECPFDASQVFVQVEVVKSELISDLVQVTGWTYFVAWSISFYPQIVLNFQRKSVVGLNFDFLLLNVIGFACYTVYNALFYFDPHVQQLYLESKGEHSLIPVLVNDVVFAGHAFLACVVTALQCFIYDRGAQRVSYVCRGWASLLLLFVAVSLALTLSRVLNWLSLINHLSYVKMAVTLSKYLPQAILNFKRKSTIGWSIGNILLDFTGGSMEICQMCLQAVNTDDWTGFTGNVVKFGLGLVSMLFDVLFIVQHYVLYREKSDFNSFGTSSSASPRTAIVPFDQQRGQRLEAADNVLSA